LGSKIGLLLLRNIVLGQKDLKDLRYFFYVRPPARYYVGTMTRR
jgi:hypothetical protein